MNSKGDLPEGPTARTSKHIAFVLLAMYSISLAAILVGSLYESSSGGRVWFDLFKSGFLLLGGALTTIIGYYFGSRGVHEAEANAANARKEEEKAKLEAEEAKKRISELEERLAPTYEEVSLDKVNEERENP